MNCPNIRRPEDLAATVPARSARAFLGHPTRFERVTLAFGALLLTPQPTIADIGPIG